MFYAKSSNNSAVENDMNPEPPRYGKRRYSRLMRMFREEFVSVCVYKTVHEHMTFYDTVIFRKVKSNGELKFKRGANFKPEDIPRLIELLKEVDQYLNSVSSPEGD